MLTSIWSIVNDNSESFFKTFLLCYNLCGVEKMAKNLAMPLLSLQDHTEVYAKLINHVKG
ncbi:hypothetical protein Hanom_Chr16g01510721 [Helianthus anomalus]